MDTATFTAFLTYALVMAITPGPNNILTLSCVGRHGLRGSSRLIWGKKFLRKGVKIIR